MILEPLVIAEPKKRGRKPRAQPPAPASPTAAILIYLDQRINDTLMATGLAYMNLAPKEELDVLAQQYYAFCHTRTVVRDIPQP